MTARKNLLFKGNSKLGEAIHQWSIPAGDTCPGQTPTCMAHCYAQQGRYRTSVMNSLLNDNLDQAIRRDFTERIVKEIVRRGVHLLRVHVAGDFFSPEYAQKWIDIAHRSTRTTFYAYTRSWRCEEYNDVLAAMAELENFKLWFSLDKDTGCPEVIPPGVRLAYMQTAHTEDPGDVELVFRLHELRTVPRARIGLAVVCSTETGKPSDDDRTCTSCRRCFT